jgi:hypothetical protein
MPQSFHVIKKNMIHELSCHIAHSGMDKAKKVSVTDSARAMSYLWNLLQPN